MTSTTLIKKLVPEAIIPSYQTCHAAGFDFHSIQDLVIEPGKRAIIGTGLSVALDPSLELQIRPRSGLTVKHGITVLNSPGTIDADYRGEIKIILINLSNEDFYISKGDRIAQGILSKVTRVAFEEVLELNSTNRGDNGFGSTGK